MTMMPSSMNDATVVRCRPCITCEYNRDLALGRQLLSGCNGNSHCLCLSDLAGLEGNALQSRAIASSRLPSGFKCTWFRTKLGPGGLHVVYCSSGSASCTDLCYSVLSDQHVVLSPSWHSLLAAQI
jgi:hypothetical protein